MRADSVADQAVPMGGDEQGHEFYPLRARAVVLIILLAGTLAAVAARLAIPMLDPDSPFHAEIDVRPFVVASRLLMVVTAIAFLAWFRGARINAEGRG